MTTSTTIETLVEDIERVLTSPDFGEVTEDDHHIGGSFVELLQTRLDPSSNNKEKTESSDKGFLRASNVGTICPRQLWYKIHKPTEGEELLPNTRLKFLYGDVIEMLVLELARKAGHRVELQQQEVDILGVKGHLDAVIDGMLVDVKSCSSYSFKAFKEGLRPENDKFGYIDQLGFYLGGLQDNDLVTEKSKAAFLAVDKVTGSLCLDVHNYEEPTLFAERTVSRAIKIAESETEPERGFSDVPDGKSGNRKLGVECSYCAFKHLCWPKLETYFYSNGPRFLTVVERIPKVQPTGGF